jgi:uncharacterized membrane protein YkvA (DUF1232 family)
MTDIKFGEILLPGDPDTEAQNEKTVRAKFWPKIRKVVGKVPFARDAVAAFYCATDRNTSFKTKGIIFAALAYFVMPIDVVPDLFAVIGFTDDLAVLTAAFALIRSSVREEHYAAADAALEKTSKDPSK